MFLVRKRGGADDGKLYAMKVVKKAEIVHGDTGKQVWLRARKTCEKRVPSFSMMFAISLSFIDGDFFLIHRRNLLGRKDTFWSRCENVLFW